MLSTLDASVQPRLLPLEPVLGHWIDQSSVAAKMAALIFGVALLSVLAQIAIPLPFTPVPITGQTFGVALLSLMMGRKWGFSTVTAYVCLGAVGLPIFAQASAGLRVASSGYLVGMCVASFVVGNLADRGWSKTFWKSFAACFLGSVCVFSFGLVVLYNFVPAGTVLTAGLLPFIPGDLIKTATASAIASRVNRVK